MVRPIRAETVRYGEYSKAGEFVYDHPFQWGSRRIGPDLHRVGNKYPHYWHVRHMEAPGEVTPGSIMPPYPWLLTQEIDFDSIAGTVRAMEILGASYDDVNGRIPEAALDQARAIGAEIVEQGGPEGLETRKIVALVAYLQRMGTDIFKAPPEEAAVADDVSAAAPASSTKAK
jgi:cytochrome c oxidase cbb3-type subunit I/II